MKKRGRLSFEDDEEVLEDFKTVRGVGTFIDDDDDEKKPKYVPLHQQEAVDEQGRRRFHGAFTGGFSAGYFNTVGSREGFTPLNFVSSRNQKAANKTMTIDDFMDEEDRESERIVTKPEFEAIGSTAAELAKKKQSAGDEKSQSFTDLNLDSLVVARKERIGYKLLRKMGWKEPVKTKSIKKSDLTSKLHKHAQMVKEGESIDISVESDEEEDNSEEEKIDVVLPNNTQIDYTPKLNTYGLGYDPYSTLPEMRAHKMLMEERKNLEMMKKGKKGRGEAFGIGVFEENDDIELYDDEDSFDHYDRVIGGEKKHNVESVDKGKKKADLTQQNQSSTSQKRCHDGKLPIRGFSLSTLPPPNLQYFAPPLLPPNFNPIHKYADRKILPKKTETLPFENAKPQTSETITPQKRSQMLGEKQLPSTPIVAPPPSSVVTPSPSNTPSNVPLTKIISPSLYESVFKPLSDSMANKFTKAETLDPENQKRNVIEQKVEEYQDLAASLKMFGKLTRKVEDWNPTPLLCKRYGFKPPRVLPLANKSKTSSESKWTKMIGHPTENNDVFNATQTTPPPNQESRQLPIEFSKNTTTTTTTTNTTTPIMITPNQSLLENKNETPKTEPASLLSLSSNTPNRPPINLFKAIFENDDEEEEEESEEKEKEETDKKKENQTPQPQPQNIRTQNLPKTETITTPQTKTEPTAKIQNTNSTQISQPKIDTTKSQESAQFLLPAPPPSFYQSPSNPYLSYSSRDNRGSSLTAPSQSLQAQPQQHKTVKKEEEVDLDEWIEKDAEEKKSKKKKDKERDEGKDKDKEKEKDKDKKHKHKHKHSHKDKDRDHKKDKKEKHR